jgi:alpha-L-fucosidase 2
MKPHLLLAFLFATAGAAHAAAVQTDIEYGTAGGVSLRLDAYVPDGPGPFPAVILVHGGGWNAGDKSGGPKKGYMAPMFEPLSQAGFAWFSINYRLAPQFHYPAAVEDVETSIRWLKAHAAEYHVDPKRIALSGESAGGQLVGLVGTRATDDSTRVVAVVAFYGLFDFVAEQQRRSPTLTEGFARLFGRAALDEPTLKLMREASAINYVKPGLPPFLFVHGTKDQSVSFQQSVDMQAKLRAAGVPAELIAIPEGPHGMLPWPPLAPDFKDRVIAWLRVALNYPAPKTAP